jgi:protein-L-isoaspartate(D-aspartate) O-methyltransferase
MLAAMTGSELDPSASRADMVERQLRARGIADERVLEAMSTVPRETFVPEGWRRRAYADEALPIDAGQTISQPVIVARMTELLQIAPGDRILEIGTGSGYQAAILASLGAEVTSLERQHDLVAPARQRLGALGLDRNVTIREADGSLGEPAGAPWDAIIVTAAAPAIPMPLRDQLADGARLVIPVGPRDQQFLTVVERRGSEWTEWTDGACVFVPLIGLGGFEPRPGDRTEPPAG